jgi:hypothetical protein
MQKQIIYLLDVITRCQIKDFKLEYNEELISCAEPLIPRFLKKNKQISFFLKFKAPVPAAILQG